MRLHKKNYAEFSEAFDVLAKLAANNNEIRSYLYRLHNKVTNGATARIFSEKELPLEYLKISAINYERYIKQHENDEDIIKVD